MLGNVRVLCLRRWGGVGWRVGACGGGVEGRGVGGGKSAKMCVDYRSTVGAFRSSVLYCSAKHQIRRSQTV